MPTKKPLRLGYMEDTDVQQALRVMEADNSFKTESSYSPNATLYPDQVMSFQAKHMAYLKANPALNPEQYLANLRLKTKLRS
jgi:hypothetical protein